MGVLAFVVPVVELNVTSPLVLKATAAPETAAPLESVTVAVTVECEAPSAGMFAGLRLTATWAGGPAACAWLTKGTASRASTQPSAITHLVRMRADAAMSKSPRPFISHPKCPRVAQP